MSNLMQDWKAKRKYRYLRQRSERLWRQQENIRREARKNDWELTRLLENTSRKFPDLYKTRGIRWSQSALYLDFAFNYYLNKLFYFYILAVYLPLAKIKYILRKRD